MLTNRPLFEYSPNDIDKVLELRASAESQCVQIALMPRVEFERGIGRAQIHTLPLDEARQLVDQLQAAIAQAESV